MAGDLQGVDLWLVDSLVVPASLHDVEGRFLRLNAAAERAIGSSNAHWLGRQFTEPVPPEAREDVELIASGRSTSEIARELTLSTETVRNHLRKVLEELHVHTRVEAIVAAQRCGLLAAPVLGPQPSEVGVDPER